VYKTTASQGLK